MPGARHSPADYETRLLEALRGRLPKFDLFLSGTYPHSHIVLVDPRGEAWVTIWNDDGTAMGSDDVEERADMIADVESG